jgi:putative transposase
MARKPRIEYEGAFYHVIIRGNQRQKIFKEPVDYDKYHQYLVIYKNRYQYALYAYVLMSNHVHLLIETRDVPLSRIMQGINQSYTLYFNRKYKEVGHLFQGRYKAILCDRDAYLLSLLKYIHYNPVRAKLSESPDLYPWSSHQAYIGKNNSLSLVDTDNVLRMFSESKAKARKRYVTFMAGTDRLKKGEVYATIDQRLQGDEEFVDQVQKRVDAEIKKERRKKEHSLSAICKVVEESYGATRDQLRASGKERQVMAARRIFAQAAKLYGYPGKEIAAFLKKDPASVTGYVREEDLSKEVANVARTLSESRKNVNSEV